MVRRHAVNWSTLILLRNLLKIRMKVIKKIEILFVFWLSLYSNLTLKLPFGSKYLKIPGLCGRFFSKQQSMLIHPDHLQLDLWPMFGLCLLSSFWLCKFFSVIFLMEFNQTQNILLNLSVNIFLFQIHCQSCSIHDNSVVGHLFFSLYASLSLFLGFKTYWSAFDWICSSFSLFFRFKFVHWQFDDFSEEFHEFSGLDDSRLARPYSHKPSYKFATTPFSHTDSTISKYFKEMHSYMLTWVKSMFTNALSNIYRIFIKLFRNFNQQLF